MKRRSVLFLSHVGGGPMERVARYIERAEVSSRYSALSWQRRMASGGFGRLSARAGAFLLFPIQALWRAWSRRPAAIVATTNPFFLPVFLLLTKPLHRVPVVPLIYDLYPDALEAAGLTRARGRISRVAARLNRFLFRHADGVVFIGHAMAEHAIDRYGEPTLWQVIETGADPTEFEDARRQEPRRDFASWCADRPLIGYVGNLGRMHDWESMAGALPRLAADARFTDTARLIIAASGPGAERIRSVVEPALRDDAIRFAEPLADDEWATLMRRIDVSLATLGESAAKTCVPSKAFSALAAGSCVVAVAPSESDLARLVTEHECGVLVEPGDADGLEHTLRFLTEDPEALRRLRENALRAARLYAVDTLATRWSEILHLARARSKPSWVYYAAKRTLDVGASAIALVTLAPVLGLVGLAVWCTNGRPVFFRQERPGLGGRPFVLTKFRTMRAGVDARATDEQRLTALGRFLRRTSLDELPTLINVLRGEMSLVGPRPLLVRYLERYTADQGRRHEVKPGVTGWAQVNGRNAIGWHRKLELDVWYVDHRSLILDLKILAMTVAGLLKPKGISHQGYATMPEFLGNAEDHPLRPHDS